jgi:acid phosphatase
MSFTHYWLKILFPLIIGVLFLTFWNRASLPSVPGITATNAISEAHKQGTPWSGNWRTWSNHHEATRPSASQPSGEVWNILHHLGGNGPWIENIHEAAATSYDIPDNCSIDQVHLVC